MTCRPCPPASETSAGRSWIGAMFATSSRQKNTGGSRLPARRCALVGGVADLLQRPDDQRCAERLLVRGRGDVDRVGARRRSARGRSSGCAAVRASRRRCRRRARRRWRRRSRSARARRSSRSRRARRWRSSRRESSSVFRRGVEVLSQHPAQHLGDRPLGEVRGVEQRGEQRGGALAPVVLVGCPLRGRAGRGHRAGHQQRAVPRLRGGDRRPRETADPRRPIGALTARVEQPLAAFNKKTQRTPPEQIRLAERRLRDWRSRSRAATSRRRAHRGTGQ